MGGQAAPVHLEEQVDGARVHEQVVVRDHDVVVAAPAAAGRVATPGWAAHAGLPLPHLPPPCWQIQRPRPQRRQACSSPKRCPFWQCATGFPGVAAPHLSRAQMPAHWLPALLLPALISRHTICHFIESGMRSASVHCRVAR